MSYPCPRILADDLIRSATLSATPSLTLGANYLKSQARSEVARSSSAADQTITGNFAAASSVSCAVLWRHNLTAAGTWRLELFSATNQGGTTLYDSTATDAFTADPLESLISAYDPLGAEMGEFQQPAQHSVLWFSAVTAASFRLTLSDSANPDGYLQASRLMMGAYWEPSQGANYGHQLQWIDDTPQVRTEGGTIRNPRPRGPYRQMSFDFSQLTGADANALARLVARVGKRAEVFVSLYPTWGEQDNTYLNTEYLHAFIGKLSGQHSATRRTWSMWSDLLVFQEI